MKAYRLGSNKTGKRFAVVKRGEGFIVIAESKNYERGHTVTKWRLCEQYRNQHHHRKTKFSSHSPQQQEYCLIIPCRCLHFCAKKCK